MLHDRASRTGARVAAALLTLSVLAGCAGRFDHLGREPTMSPVGGVRDAIDPSLPAGALGGVIEDPIAGVGGGGGDAGPLGGGAHMGGRYDGGALGPGAAPVGAASLWTSGPSSLFGDRRARTVGDILTVVIEIDDSASVQNSSSRERSGSTEVGSVTAFGLESVVDRIIPGDTVGLEAGASASGQTQSGGSGEIEREEAISLRIAATVVDILQNGHLVIAGSQEVRVNFELRDLQVAGVIRPEDIQRDNTITYDKIASARISYGGRGHISDVQQPGLGQQIVDTIAPF